ncbi:S41 family peptidase [Oceanobacillus halotolerans]|uniref:S41 family peptidase n=1 Tax=Oceanobacillus halotolerans TaxID=2663380 RepID=UPI0013DCF231|nr:S41 family peptidase [Oceanobacillus halotolerans]
MNLKKSHITLILVAAIVLGFVGAYTGVKVAQPDEQNEGSTNDLSDLLGQESLNTPQNMEKVAQAYQVIKQNYIEDVDDTQLIEGAIKGMLGTLEDPYSTYMDVETMEDFNETIESSFQGIGAEVSMVNGNVTIVSPIKDSPAEEAGLRPNDQILSVDGESVKGLELNEAVEKIRGEKGSEVTIEILRSGVSDPFEVTLVRDDIPLETVYSSTETVDGKKTGILELTSFSETTYDEFTEQLNDLEEEGIEGLVIDVRGNPGGLLTAVEDILKLFIPSDMPIVQIEDPNGNRDQTFSDLEEMKEYPITVLIDEGSASASEILAVAMKEAGYDVVGKTSFGKGTVQQAIPLGDGSSIKITFFKWLSPNGEWINEVGVEPTMESNQPDYFYTSPVEIEEPLGLDDADQKIENLQIMLTGLGYDTGREDGYFDSQTEEAVMAFQQDNDLNVTGEIDQETAGTIEANVVENIRNGVDDLQMEDALRSLYEE